MKRIKYIIFILIIALLELSTSVFAATNVLKTVQKSSETKYLENDQGYITKSITDTDEAKVVQNNTKQTILDLKNSGIYTIAMLTGLSEEDGNTDKNGTVYTDNNTI